MSLQDQLRKLAEEVLAAEPLHGVVGYHGDEEVWGEVDEATSLACLILDEVIPLLDKQIERENYDD